MILNKIDYPIFKIGTKNGKTKEYPLYNEKGLLITERNYRDHKLTGKYIIYGSGGNVVLLQELEKGELKKDYLAPATKTDENKINFWPNGKKRSEYEIKNGKANGKGNMWYENGAKEFECEYKDDKMNGKAICWYQSGAKMYECEYINDKRNGKFTMWDEKGVKIVEQKIKDNEVIVDYLKK